MVFSPLISLEELTRSQRNMAPRATRHRRRGMRAMVGVGVAERHGDRTQWWRARRMTSTASTSAGGLGTDGGNASATWHVRERHGLNLARGGIERRTPSLHLGCIEGALAWRWVISTDGCGVERLPGNKGSGRAKVCNPSQPHYSRSRRDFQGPARTTLEYGSQRQGKGRSGSQREGADALCFMRLHRHTFPLIKSHSAAMILSKTVFLLLCDPLRS